MPLRKGARWTCLDVVLATLIPPQIRGDELFILHTEQVRYAGNIGFSYADTHEQRQFAPCLRSTMPITPRVQRRSNFIYLLPPHRVRLHKIR